MPPSRPHNTIPAQATQDLDGHRLADYFQICGRWLEQLNARRFMGSFSEPWDYLILTASSDVQAAAYERQLQMRRQLQLLCGARQTMVVADPGGRRVGSGGSTICSLLAVLDREMTGLGGDRASPELWTGLLRQLRILIIHAGGDSRRLPAYSPCGKLFVPLPGAGDSALATTLFDRQLPLYLDLPPGQSGAGQVVIASGDVLLGFAPEEVRLASSGITGLACSASATASTALTAMAGCDVSCKSPRSPSKSAMGPSTATAARCSTSAYSASTPRPP